MGSVLLKPPARSLLIADRMPTPGTGHPFQGEGEIMLECGVAGCGCVAMGKRADMDLWRRDHYRRFHASDHVGGLFRINDPTTRAK